MPEPTEKTRHGLNCLNAALVLVRIHKLMSVGEGDSEKADALRDEADLLCRGMTVAEMDVLREISVELYNVWEVPGA